MRSRAGGGGEAEETAAVAGTPSFTAIAVNGSLQLARGAQALSLALVRVEVLHIPVEDGGVKAQFNIQFEDTVCVRLLECGLTFRKKKNKTLSGDGPIVHL